MKKEKVATIPGNQVQADTIPYTKNGQGLLLGSEAPQIFNYPNSIHTELQGIWMQA